MNPFERLPIGVLRHGIFPYLDSLDILACRYTCKSLKFDAAGAVTMLADGHNRNSKYWRWIYDIVECWCYSCEPMCGYLYWVTRVAPYRTVAAFFNSNKYNMIAKHCPEALGRCMMGACARGDMRIAKIARGATPQNCYRLHQVLAETAKFNHTKLFNWLIHMKDLPPQNSMEAFQICIHIGESGNVAMMRSLVMHGFGLESDHWWLVTIHALNHQHYPLLRYIYAYAPQELYTRRFMLASITNDNAVAFQVYLEKSPIWPTIEDSEHLRIYRAVKVARIWDMLGLPMLYPVIQWFARI